MENRHHFFWPRKGYKTRLEKELRSDGLTIVRVNAALHQELHATLPPPPKPTRDETLIISQRLQAVSGISACPFRGILEIVRMYGSLSEHYDAEVSQRARTIRGNLLGQLGILATEVMSPGQTSVFTMELPRELTFSS